MEPRFTFDRIAGLYDAARAGYPDAVFQRLAKLADPGRSVLEVGCGAGKATVGLAALAAITGGSGRSVVLMGAAGEGIDILTVTGDVHGAVLDLLEIKK